MNISHGVRWPARVTVALGQRLPGAVQCPGHLRRSVWAHLAGWSNGRGARKRLHRHCGATAR